MRQKFLPARQISSKTGQPCISHTSEDFGTWLLKTPELNLQLAKKLKGTGVGIWQLHLNYLREFINENQPALSGREIRYL
jgi:hypothetical protein